MRWLKVPSPVGDLIAVAGAAGLRQLRFDGPVPGVDPTPDDPLLQATARQLAAYFDGRLTGFEVPLELVGSAFEKAVWAALERIPYAETRSYGDIARAVTDDVGASRAVGIANNHNPVPIIVPCHRVVGANRKLVGYGGGLHRKRYLLELEARVQLTAGLLSG
jgi:methylated-DNA-[protein]-cysteine S-methyltransferase